MIATETSTCIISIKIGIHIYAAKIFTCISVAETSNCIIAIETVTFVTENFKKRSTNISVAESTTSIIAIKPQNPRLQQMLPPAELTTEAFTCRNGDNQIVLVTIKKLSE